MDREKTFKSKNHVEYGAWVNMIHRCHNPDHKAYPSYGGRGITVCDEWRTSFEQFMADMGRKPDPTLSLDRIDNDKGYHKDNCRWADRRTQQNNRNVAAAIQSITSITWQGRTMPVWQWANHLGLNLATLHSRLKVGMPLARALNSRLFCRAGYNLGKPYEFQGKKQTAKQWAEEFSTSTSTIYRRAQAGEPLDGSSPLVNQLTETINILEAAVASLESSLK